MGLGEPLHLLPAPQIQSYCEPHSHAQAEHIQVRSQLHAIAPLAPVPPNKGWPPQRHIQAQAHVPQVLLDKRLPKVLGRYLLCILFWAGKAATYHPESRLEWFPLLSQIYVIVTHHGCSRQVVTICHHQPPRQNANTAFKDTAIYVKFEAGYVFTLQEHLSEC